MAQRLYSGIGHAEAEMSADHDAAQLVMDTTVVNAALPDGNTAFAGDLRLLFEEFRRQLMTSGNFLNWSEAAVTVLDNARSGTVILRDGSTALIRQVQAADAPLLADGFARLSPESRATRCLGAKKELSLAELRYLTDVDHHDHEALGALEYPGGKGVGIARYIRQPGDPQTAEIAVTVVDGWQGLGLGTELIRQLSRRARRAGIRRFTAMATADNVAAGRLLRTLGAQPVHRGAGAVEYEITLEPGA